MEGHLLLTWLKRSNLYLYFMQIEIKTSFFYIFIQIKAIIHLHTCVQGHEKHRLGDKKLMAMDIMRENITSMNECVKFFV